MYRESLNWGILESTATVMWQWTIMCPSDVKVTPLFILSPLFITAIGFACHVTRSRSEQKDPRPEAGDRTFITSYWPFICFFQSVALLADRFRPYIQTRRAISDRVFMHQTNSDWTQNNRPSWYLSSYFKYSNSFYFLCPRLKNRLSPTSVQCFLVLQDFPHGQ